MNSIEKANAGFILLAAAMVGDSRPRLSNGELKSMRGGFGSTAKRMRQRARQFAKMEARRARQLRRAAGVA